MRNFSRTVDGVCITTSRDVGAGSSTSSTNGPYVAEAESFTANRARTPGYWKLKKSGAPIPDLPYSCSYNKSKAMNGRFLRKFWFAPWGMYRFEEEYNGVISSFYSGNNDGPDRVYANSGVDNVVNHSAMKALNSLKGSSFNAVVTAAELGQTVSMIASFARSASDAIIGLRRGNIHAAAAALGCKPLGRRARAKFRREYTYDQSKAVANGWLAYKYGWMPLLQDVRSAAELASSRITLPPPQRVSAQHTLSMADSADFEGGWHWYGRNGPTKTVTSRINTSCRTTFVFRQSGTPQLPTALGLTNPALVAWELVPLSFVVDWVLPVGDYLNSLDATIGWDLVRGFQTIKVAEKHTQRWHGQYYYGWDEIREADAMAHQESKYFQRNVFKSFPSVDFLALASVPKNNPNASMFASAVSLLRQFFK